MTTVTIQIDQYHHLKAVEELADKLGLKYEVDEQAELQYTDEVKNMLDTRYADFKSGRATMISAEESRAKIHKLFPPKQ